MTDPGDLFAIVIAASVPAAEILQDILVGDGMNTAVDIHVDRGDADVLVYADSIEEARARHAELVARQPDWSFLPGPPAVDPELRRLPREDWQESWKRHFHARRVSDRIVIKPSWETWEAAPADCILEIDPGMSFGTGQHGTTVACLQLLDTWAAAHPGASCLDAGCGSGILAIAAARLGLTPVRAVDNDPDAVRIARENAAANGVAEAIAFAVADLGAGLPGTADLVLANILAPVLLANAQALAGAVNPGGRLVLSGILTEQFPAIRARWAQLGWSCEIEVTIAEWTSGRFARNEQNTGN